MKSKLFFLFLAATQFLFAQNFTEVSQFTLFEGGRANSVAFADVDGDNDQDVIISGWKNSARITNLFTNDGGGSFTEINSNQFEDIAAFSIAFADIDGDNDLDVLITGLNSSNDHLTKLYTNDGSGSFTEVFDTPFEGVIVSSIAFADVDGDNDIDVLITGLTDSFFSIAKLYANDGTGSFTEITDTPFEGISFSSIAFADVDGDNDQDVLITGLANSFSHITKLYTNNGSGSYIEIIGTPFEGVRSGSIAFADIDGDNDQDVLITGQDSLETPISKLYTNDGGGSFTEITDNPFEGVKFSSIAFADVDMDSDQDVLITGQNGSNAPISKLYTNDGSGSFTEIIGNSFEGALAGSIAFADVDGDNDQDVLITGQDSSETHISKLYTNDAIISSSDDIIVDVSLNLTTFPNPTISNKLNISFKSMEQNSIIVRVYDLNGHLISQQKEFAGIGEQTLEVDITSLSKGSYFIQLENGKILGSAKFIVQ